MINETMQRAFNEQINHETFSAYLYLAMAADFETKGFEGMANWMKVQAQEEMTHAMKFFNHIAERGGRVVLAAIEKPQTEWADPLAAFQAAFTHEQFITGKINDLMTLAHEQRDYAAVQMLNWFVDEQVEEEATASRLVDQLGLVGKEGQGLLMLDRELGARTFAPPPADENAG